MREVRIHDTLSGSVRALEPRDPPRVGIYACGPTTYGRIHVGNARPFVIFMLLRRFLAHCGYRPALVINVTDINDKIYDAAAERGIGSAELAREMTEGYIADTDALGLGRPDHEPLASGTVAEIVELITALIDSCHAYESGGDVYFSVRRFDGYGRLSNRDPAEMDQGEEAGSSELKRDPLDFALWKATKPGEDTSWPSPWGDGRPGWHIECSAMAEKLLGTDFEIHGGGSDLVFPHHENEIAQTEAARGEPLARIWMHNGMVESDREQKMAKSVGNIFLLSEAIERYGAEAVIAFIVGGHYRQPIAFGADALERAQASNERVRDFFRGGADEPESAASPQASAALDRFEQALADDFNTPRAVAELFDLISAANREPLPGAAAVLRTMLGLLGLESLARVSDRDRPDSEARELLAERERARGERDFALADALRDELAERGWEVRDGAGGARLVRRG